MCFSEQHSRELQHMQPFLSAALTSAAPHPSLSPSIPFSPSRLHPRIFPPSPSIHSACFHLLLHAATFLPCGCRPIPVLVSSVVPMLLCLSTTAHAAGPCLSSIALCSPAPAVAVACSWHSAGALCPAECVRSTRYKQDFSCLQTAVS